MLIENIYAGNNCTNTIKQHLRHVSTANVFEKLKILQKTNSVLKSLSLSHCEAQSEFWDVNLCCLFDMSSYSECLEHADISTLV